MYGKGANQMSANTLLIFKTVAIGLLVTLASTVPDISRADTPTTTPPTGNTGTDTGENSRGCRDTRSQIASLAGDWNVGCGKIGKRGQDCFNFTDTVDRNLPSHSR